MFVWQKKTLRVNCDDRVPAAYASVTLIIRQVFCWRRYQNLTAIAPTQCQFGSTPNVMPLREEEQSRSDWSRANIPLPIRKAMPGSRGGSWPFSSWRRWGPPSVFGWLHGIHAQKQPHGHSGCHPLLFFLTFPFVASYFSLALGRPEHSKVCRAGHSLILAHMPVSLVADDPFFLWYISVYLIYISRNFW